MFNTNKTTLSLTMLSLFASCTYASQDSVPRIIGGAAAPAPSWMVALGDYSDGKWLNYCGGTLIDKNWVLTAAHCVEEASLSGMQVAIGVSDLGQHHARTVVDQVIMHDTYLSSFIRNIGTGMMEADSDIALLHLKTASTNIPLAISNKDSQTDYGPASTFSAWGYGGINPDATLTSAQLLKVDLIFQGFRDRWNHDNTQTHIFAGNIYGQDTCRGDSGGPLTAQNSLVGITSYGSRRCGVGQPGGYTFAPLFKEWVAEKMRTVSLTSQQMVALPAGQHGWVGYTVLNASAEPVTLDGFDSDAPATRNECPQVLAAGAQCQLKVRFDANFTPDTYRHYRLNINAIKPSGASERLEGNLIAITSKAVEADTAQVTGGSSSIESHTTTSTSSSSSGGGGGSLGLIGLLLLPLTWRRRLSTSQP